MRYARGRVAFVGSSVLLLRLCVRVDCCVRGVVWLGLTLHVVFISNCYISLSAHCCCGVFVLRFDAWCCASVFSVVDC